MKLRNLLFLALPLFALSITSCGNSNGEDDNGGGGGGGKASSTIKDDSANKLSPTQQEAADFYKAMTGVEAKAGTDFDTIASKNVTVRMNLKNKYSSHQAIGELAVSKIVGYDLETYQEKGYNRYFQDLGSYDDAMTADFIRFVNDEAVASVTITTYHVSSDRDKEKLSTTKYTATGSIVTGPEIGDWFLTARFFSA